MVRFVTTTDAPPRADGGSAKRTVVLQSQHTLTAERGMVAREEHMSDISVTTDDALLIFSVGVNWCSCDDLGSRRFPTVGLLVDPEMHL
jgi:hypothetical protein